MERNRSTPLAWTVLSAAFLFALPAAACSPERTAWRFTPEPGGWSPHPGPAQTGGEGPYWEPIPAPIVGDISVTRGTRAPGASCDDAGSVSLVVSLPAGSSYAMDEFGIYFRVAEGVAPDEIFPDIPLMSLLPAEPFVFSFYWLDGAPEQQKPIDLTVETFLVAQDLAIGPSSFFRVTSD